MGFTPLILSWGDGNDIPPDQRLSIIGYLKGNKSFILISTSNKSTVTDQINVATTLARATGGSLHVLHFPSVADQASMEFRYPVSDETDQELLRWVCKRIDKSTPHDAGSIRYNHRLIRRALQTITTHDIDTLVLPSDSPGGIFGREAINWLVAHAPCDVIVINGRSGYDTVASILLPISGGPHTGLAVDVAQRIAADCDAWIDILDVVENDASDRRRERAQECVDAAYHRLALPEMTSTWILEADDTAEAIIEQSRYYELTILGAPTKHRLAQFVDGSTNRSIRANAWSVILSVRNNTTASALRDH